MTNCKEYPNDEAPKKCDRGHTLCWSKQKTDPTQDVWLAICFWCQNIEYAWYDGELIKDD